MDDVLGDEVRDDLVQAREQARQREHERRVRVRVRRLRRREVARERVERVVHRAHTKGGRSVLKAS